MTGSTLGSLGQVSMLCRSAMTSEAWYREALGLRHLYTYGPLAFFDCGGTRLFLREVADDEWRPSSILYFAVDDIHVAHATLEGRGVEFSEPPQLIHRHDDGTEEWMAFCADPDGNTLAVMSRVAPTD